MADEDEWARLDAVAGDPLRWAFVAGTQLLGVRRATLLLRDPNAPILVPAAAVGVDESVLRAIRVPIGQGIAGRVAERGMLLVGTRDEQAFLCAPITTERGVEGVLNLTERAGRQPFSEAEVAAAQALARHLGHLLHAQLTDGAGPHYALEQFEHILEREIARSKRAGQPVAVAFVRVQNLERVEEILGASRAAQLVRAVEDQLRAAHRRYDLVQRHADGTFGVICALPTIASAFDGRRIQEGIAQVARSMRLDLEVQIGIARCPEDGLTAGTLMGQAYARMVGQAEDLTARQ